MAKARTIDMTEVAVHEAGHAVAAVLGGTRLVSSDLRKSGKRDAATKFRLPLLRPGVRQGLIQLVKIGLSGQAAEDIYLGHQRPRSVSFAEMADEENYGPGDISDAVYEARHLVDFEALCFNGLQRRAREIRKRRKLSPAEVRWAPGWKTVERRCWQLYDAATRNLRRNWPAVRAVALELLKRQRLSRADVEGIMRASSDVTAREMKMRSDAGTLVGHLIFHPGTRGRERGVSLERDWEEEILSREVFDEMLKAPVNAKRIGEAMPRLVKIRRRRLHAHRVPYGRSFGVSLSACTSGCAVDQEETLRTLMMLSGIVGAQGTRDLKGCS